MIDYCLCCPRLLPLAGSLTVSPTPPTGGDHCAIRLDITLQPGAALPAPPPPPPPPTSPPPDYTIDTARLPDLEAALTSTAAQADLTAIQAAAAAADTPEAASTAALRLQNLICQAMDAAGMQRKEASQPQPRRSRPRRSAELIQLRRQRRRAVRQRAWAEVARLDTLYRRQAQRERRRRSQLRGQQLARLLRDDPAAFFARFRPPRARPSGRIPHHVWEQHFRQLLGEQPPALPVPCACAPPVPPPGDAEGAAAAAAQPGTAAATHTPPHHHEFTPTQVEAAIRRTRNRASVVGPLKPVVAKRFAAMLAPVLADLFTACARVECLPDFWACSAITPIPKSDADTTQPDGHHGIAVGTLPAKLYAAVLDRHIADWAESAGVRAEGQFGFRRRRGCAHAALVLRATIEHLRARGLRLYACFVDFQKAYDTVPRHLLWARLEQAGLEGSCIRAVQALYANVPMCVRTSEGFTDTFQSLLGVKQGCPLSPTLFGLYVDNLPAAVAETDGADLPCFADGRRVPPLLYADDLLLLSTSPAGLQRQLPHLEAYSAAWGMAVNAAKTKVVVFEGQRGGAAGKPVLCPPPSPPSPARTPRSTSRRHSNTWVYSSTAAMPSRGPLLRVQQREAALYIACAAAALSWGCREPPRNCACLIPWSPLSCLTALKFGAPNSLLQVASVPPRGSNCPSSATCWACARRRRR